MGPMSADPAVPARPPVRQPAWSLSRSAIGYWVTEGIISSLFMGLAVAVFLMFVPSTPGTPLPLLRWLVPISVAVYAVIVIGVRPRIRHRVHRWEVTDDAVYTVTGWMTRTWTLVPISRIQTVDVTRGLLQQAFGLASVAVLTASSQGTVRVPHLEVDVAQRVADDLAHRAEQVRDQAT
jgi:membrane protein YdbS with pleckstrin-like domain